MDTRLLFVLHGYNLWGTLMETRENKTRSAGCGFACVHRAVWFLSKMTFWNNWPAKNEFLARAQWQWRAIHSLKIWSDKEAEACTIPVKRKKGEGGREQGEETWGKRGQFSILMWMEFTPYSCISSCEEGFLAAGNVAQNKASQTTWGHFGDNCPNVVAQTRLFVTKIFSCKMN